MNDALASAARARGLEPSYRNAWGEDQAVPAATLERFLGLLGERDERALVPPVHVLIEHEQPGLVPIRTGDASGTLTATLIAEDGERSTSKVAIAALPLDPERGAAWRRLKLWQELPPGYHRLEVKVGGNQGALTVIVAPRRAWPGPPARAWGFAVQLYSLRSPRNWGIGDLADLRAFVEAAGGLGAHAVGVNPLHAGYGPSPYSPTSRLYRNPIYLAVDEIPGFTGLSGEDEAEAEALRALSHVDHGRVWALKRRVLARLHAAAGPDAAFDAWRRDEGEPLARFALFEALRDAHGPDKAQWPEPLQRPDSPETAAFAIANAGAVGFHAWLQWQLDVQLAACAGAARAGGMPIGLYHDLAVGVDRGGAEVWSRPDLFLVEASVGAPPDIWNPKGQDWGLPPMRPEKLQAAGYEPFAAVLRANMRHAGALRIDHILGLMRQFWVPQGAGPAEGAFVGWPIRELLSVVALESRRARCLVIGEDLGTVPEGLRELLAEFGILSYRLLYFEQENGTFHPPEAYPVGALVAVTTHDLPTLPGYWQGGDLDLRETLGLWKDEAARQSARGEREEDKRRLRQALSAAGLETSEEPPAPEIHRFMARTPSKLFLVNLEDVIGERAPANVPGTVDEYPNWRRKLAPDIAALAADPRVEVLAADMTAERPRPRPVSDVPVATYRLQLHKAFTFRDATAIVPYLAALGVSHVYVSSYLKARPGSTHGYDIVDHEELNPEIGTEAELESLSDALALHGIGQILDFVPNHMGIGQADNAWWLDVLERGQGSAYARYFDIDWQADAPRTGKLVVPVLGDQYGKVLESGDLKLAFDPETGGLAFRYFTHLFPLRLDDYAAVVDRAGLGWTFADGVRAVGDAAKQMLARLGDGEKQQLVQALAALPASALHDLLEHQHYRLSSWRVAADEINYRRFFDVNDLAGIRMEEPALFARAHRRVRRLITEGRLHGIRLDHVDGLFDPVGYFRRLREMAAAAGRPAMPIYVEKILARHERLRPGWPVTGTTGYEVLNQINNVFVQPKAERALTRAYQRFSERPMPFEQVLYDSKRQVMDSLLASELGVLAQMLDRLTEQNPKTRDFTRRRLERALMETVAAFPVYRTYVDAAGADAADRRDVDWAIGQARKRWQGADVEVLDLVRAALLGELGDEHDREAALGFAMKFQQYTGPVTAKSLEDTTFYRYVPLLSVNEVGGDPRQFGTAVAAFHKANEERARHFPHGMVGTATHDTKRGLDTRARLDVLSEMTRDWTQHVRRWSTLNRSKRQRQEDGPAPSRNDEWMIYQMLLGAWPFAGGEAAPEALADFTGRFAAAVLKSIREAKLRTSWTNPDPAYEKAVETFITRLLDAGHKNPFLDDFRPFADRIGWLGALGGLGQTALALTIPGVPDVYQGGELWNLSLVDPDNRRPVDYDLRRTLLDERAPVPELLHAWPDGRIKFRVVHALLQLRQRRAALFAGADYTAIDAGERAIAFARRDGDARVTVVAGRFFAGHAEEPGTWPGFDVKGSIDLGAGATDVLTGARHAGTVALATLLATLPVAVLESGA